MFIDYRLDARTRVRIFDTHLEVGSPVRAAQVQVAQGNEFLALTGANATEFRERRREYERRVEAVLVEGIESGDFRQLDPSWPPADLEA